MLSLYAVTKQLMESGFLHAERCKHSEIWHDNSHVIINITTAGKVTRSPFESITTWFKTIVRDDVTIPVSRVCGATMPRRKWQSLEIRFALGYFEDCTRVRNKMIHSLPCITVFVVTRGAICQRFSLVTASFVKIIGKSPHSWPRKPLYMVTHALFSIYMMQ